MKKTYFITIIMISNIMLLILFPEISKCGVAKGITISANVIIPSLFPFMVCVLMLMKNYNNSKNVLTNKSKIYYVFLLSILGGYPVGASLINELYTQKTINAKTADIMQSFCVNAGPAFIVIVVGNALGSKKLGIFLLISHVIASCIILGFSIKKLNLTTQKNNQNELTSLSKSLTNAVSNTCDNLIKICSFIVLFSVINSYLDYFLAKTPILKYIPFFTEVTYAVMNCKNIYLLSFLLGFAGISIWFQIISISEGRKINMLNFILSRIAHGTLSAVLTFLLLKIFKIKVSVFSNNVSFKKEFYISNLTLFISMTIMLIVFFISTFCKNNSRKFMPDML